MKSLTYDWTGYRRTHTCILASFIKGPFACDATLWIRRLCLSSVRAALFKLFIRQRHCMCMRVLCLICVRDSEPALVHPCVVQRSKVRVWRGCVSAEGPVGAIGVYERKIYCCSVALTHTDTHFCNVHTLLKQLFSLSPV